MEITRKTYLFVAALLVLPVAGWPTEMEARSGKPTCGRCEEWGPLHGLLNGGEKCGWPNPGAGHQCSRYLPRAGRIDLVPTCAPSSPAATVPVPPEIRTALDRALKDPGPALVGLSRDTSREQALQE